MSAPCSLLARLLLLWFPWFPPLPLLTPLPVNPAPLTTSPTVPPHVRPAGGICLAFGAPLALTRSRPPPPPPLLHFRGLLRLFLPPHYSCFCVFPYPNVVGSVFTAIAVTPFPCWFLANGPWLAPRACWQYSFRPLFFLLGSCVCASSVSSVIQRCAARLSLPLSVCHHTALFLLRRLLSGAMAFPPHPSLLASPLRLATSTLVPPHAPLRPLTGSPPPPAHHCAHCVRGIIAHSWPGLLSRRRHIRLVLLACRTLFRSYPCLRFSGGACFLLS